MKVTKHGQERTSDRVGVPRKAVAKLAGEALESGVRPSQFSGSFRRYLDKLGILHKTTPIVHHGHIFIFSADVLVTAWPVPSKYRAYTPRVKP